MDKNTMKMFRSCLPKSGLMLEEKTSGETRILVAVWAGYRLFGDRTYNFPIVDDLIMTTIRRKWLEFLPMYPDAWVTCSFDEVAEGPGVFFRDITNINIWLNIPDIVDATTLVLCPPEVEYIAA